MYASINDIPRLEQENVSTALYPDTLSSLPWVANATLGRSSYDSTILAMER
jgi:hypothetical protein